MSFDTGTPMRRGDGYRIKAAELMARGRTKPVEAIIRSAYERLALSYLRLADQADRYSDADAAYEAPSDGATDHRVRRQPRIDDE